MNTAKLLSVAEHAHYPFKSYPRTRCSTVLFPGCSFPSQFPRTMDAVAEACRTAGFGIAYDCCGSPLAGFGEQRKAERVIARLNRRLAGLGCSRVVLLCPNCLSYLGGKLECETVSFFDVLQEVRGASSEGGPFADEPFCAGSLFVPCPDKRTRNLEQKLRCACDLSAVTTLNRAPCCGLRPDLAAKGTAYSSKLGAKAIEQAHGTTIYTYCASCLGQFSRLGYGNCRHVISAMLGIDEPPDSAHALMNRAKRAFDKNTDPICDGLAR